MNPNARKRFAETYAECFCEVYPELPTDRSAHLISRAVMTATRDIHSVDIRGAAFRLTAKRLGIKQTHQAFQAYLNEEPGEPSE